MALVGNFSRLREKDIQMEASLLETVMFLGAVASIGGFVLAAKTLYDNQD